MELQRGSNFPVNDYFGNLLSSVLIGIGEIRYEICIGIRLIVRKKTVLTTDYCTGDSLFAPTKNLFQLMIILPIYFCVNWYW